MQTEKTRKQLRKVIKCQKFLFKRSQLFFYFQELSFLTKWFGTRKYKRKQLPIVKPLKT